MKCLHGNYINVEDWPPLSSGTLSINNICSTSSLLVCRALQCTFNYCSTPLHHLPTTTNHSLQRWITWHHTNQSRQEKLQTCKIYDSIQCVWWWLDLGQTWDMTPRDSVVATTKIFGTRNYFRPLLLSASRSRDTCEQVVDNLKSFRVTAGEKKSNLSGVEPVLSRQRKLVNWCLIVSKLRSRQERKHTSVITARF